MTTNGAQLSGMTAAVRRLVADSSVVLLGDHDLLAHTREVEELGRMVDVLRAEAAGELDRRSPYGAGTDGLSYRYGHRRAVQLVEALTRVSQHEAAHPVSVARLLARGTALDPSGASHARRELAQAVLEGAIGVEVAGTIGRVLDRAQRVASDEQVAAAEVELVAAARVETAAAVRVQASVWEAFLDPDGQTPRDEAQHQSRAFRIGRERTDGMTPFSGTADPIHAALLREALSAYASPAMEPRFLPDRGAAAMDDDAPAAAEIRTGDRYAVVPMLKDPRSREQRDFDILLGLVRAGLGNPDAAPAEPVTIDVSVTLADLEAGRGVGWIEGIVEPLSIATVQRMRCGGAWLVTVPGSHGEILHRGRTRRAFTRAQRRAMARRDGGCVWPGCTAPASWCDGHHVVEWADDGPSDLDNGVLLCPAHHRMLHTSAFRIRMIHGVPHLLAPAHLHPDQVWTPLARHRIDRLLRRRTAA